MFPIKAKTVLPVDKIIIHSISVRGQLGPMSVWVTKEEIPECHNTNTNNNNNNSQSSSRGRREYNFRLTPRHWTKLVEYEMAPSPDQYAKIQLPADKAITIRPGHVRAIYIHSKHEGDEAIVYDNSSTVALGSALRRSRMHQRPQPRHDDALITICSGKAHLSNIPFGQVPIWGWGNAWRDHREFVGQVEYGCVYQLWSPECHNKFGTSFHHVSRILALCQRRSESPVSILPDECLFYILHMCRWDWFGDTTEQMNVVKRNRKRRRRLLEQQQERDRNDPQMRPQQAARIDTTNSHQPMDEDDHDADNEQDDNDNHEEQNDSDEEEEEQEMLQQMDAQRVELQQEVMRLIADAVQRAAQHEQEQEANSTNRNQNDNEQQAAAANNNNNNDGAAGAAAAADDDDDDIETDESEWERANGYRADNDVFTYHDDSSME